MTPADFQALCSRHGDILDGNDTCGEGDAQTQARRYWLEHLAKPIIERTREKLQEAGKLPNVDLLISVAGFSPETTIVSAGVFQPREVLVISSARSYEHIDSIGEFLMKGGLKPSRFHHEQCIAADLSLYEIICRRVKEHRQRRGEAGTMEGDGEILVDITGGKKVMSAAAAMAAMELDLRICYVDNTYDTRRRIAIPGTENMVLLDSPYRLYGGAEQRRADHDFDLGAYDVARSRYEQLAEKVNEPARARFLRDVSAFYEAWRNLNIEGLKRAMPKVRQHLDEPLARTHRAQLDAQLRFVERLVAEERPARVMTLFLLGDANMVQGRYDFSALLFYRTIEASISSRLEQRYPGFLCEKPEYALIDPEVEALRLRFESAKKELFRKLDKSAELPNQVACFEGALLLRAQRDELLNEAPPKYSAPFSLSLLLNLIQTRNMSILAHGYQSVSESDCKKLREPAERLLRAYWRLNHEQTHFEEAIEQLRFLRLTPA